MTLSTTTYRVQYSGNGATTVFAVPFYFLTNAHIQVVLTSAAGVETVQTLTTHYSLSGAGNENGGSLTMVTAPASGTTLTVVRDVPITQDTDWVNNDPLDTDVLEEAFDKAAMIDQQLQERVDRAVQLPVSASSSISAALPLPGASKFIRWNAGGTALEAADAVYDNGNFLQSGTGAVARPVDSKLGEVVSIADFGASPAASAGDNVTAIHAAVAYAKTLDSVELLIPAGEYSVNAAIVFDLPNYSTLRCVGTLVSDVSAAVAVTVGSASSNTFGLNVIGLKVERTAVDSAGSSTGIQLLSLVASSIDIRKCTNFRLGVLCYGVSANGGFSYNQVSLGLIHDNRTNLRLSATGSGYCNENNFYGGSFNHSSGYPAVSTVNIDIVDFTSELNNNRFFGPSLEDNSALAVAATINGNSNVIFWPRLERSTSQATYEIQFAATCTECAIIGNSFSLLNSNINDLGTNTCYETREGTRVSRQVPDDAAKAVLSLQSTGTSSARLLRFLDSSGTVSGWVKGSGAAELKNLALTNLGNYVDDAAAAAGGVATNGLYRNGSVLMIRVS